MLTNSASHFSSPQRIKLLLLAVCVETFYLLIAFVPAFVIAMLSAVFYGPQIALLIGLALLIGVAWLIQPDPIDDREDIKVAPTSDLYRVVENLSKELDAPVISHIVLDDALNASAYAHRGFFVPFNVCRKLTIGIPLLRLLSGDELKAVIAHELGHFSRKHDRLGQWVYRVQYKWGVFLLMHRSADDSFIESWQKLIAQRLIPYFLEQSSAWSHQCEYEADASAQQIGLSRHLISALAKMESHGYLLRHNVRENILQWQLEKDAPPIDLQEKIHLMVQRQAPATFESVLCYARQHPRRLYDTHPRLNARADALSLNIEMPFKEGLCAGEAFFLKEWRDLFDTYQNRWLSKHQDSWRFAHYRLQWLAVQAKRQANDQYMQALAKATFSASDESLKSLRAIVSSQPTNPYLHYELGRCLLEAEDGTGLHHLQEAIKLNKKMAMASLRLIFEYQAERDSISLLSRALNRLEAANRWASRFCDDDLWTRFCTEPLEALPETGRALFASAMENDARIDGCWVGSLLSKEIEGYQFKIHLIVFRLDEANTHDSNKSEGHVRAQVADLLKVVCKPDELIRVKSVFFSEPLSPNLLRNLENHPNVCILKPKRSFNQGLIKFDSL